jgi:hypothetical protein
MIKPGLAILFVLTVTLRADTAIQPRSRQQPPERIDYTEWVGRSLDEMETIKVGSTRRDLLAVFTTEGGLSSRSTRTYVYRKCVLFKVDVGFQPVGRPYRDSEGSVTSIESLNDVITRISRPYIARPVMD